MTTELAEPPPASHDALTPPRMGLPIPHAKLGMWLFLGTEIMFFTALVGTYIVLYFGTPQWPTDPAETHINVIAGAVNTFVLLFSSYLVVVSHEALLEGHQAKARQYLWAVVACAFVFLGIKAVEYKGKFDHGIIPGQIAETPESALLHLARDVIAAVDRPIAVATAPVFVAGPESEPEDSGGGGTEESVAPILNTEQQRTKLLEELLSEETPAERKVKLQSLRDADIASQKLRDDIFAGRLTLEEAETRVEELRNDESFAGVFADLHVPHPLLYGNLFTSTYFLMTGFHAVHVIVGILLFGVVLIQRNLTPWTQWVENSGLYWHFVDLVWIFLFPLIYIVPGI